VAARNKQISLKPQDLLVLFKLASNLNERFTYAGLAQSLGIATSESHASIARVVQSRLASTDENGINLARSAFIEFVIYGAIYFFPAVMGPATRGLPTGYAAPPLKEIINQPEEMPPVWPYSLGPVRGMALYPLYPSVPAVAATDPLLYENLALFDALRAGAAREREIAQRLLRERL
jgi:hypothetical protein